MTKLIETVKPAEFRVGERMLTIGQAAKELGVHTWALRRAIRSGLSLHIDLSRTRVLVRLSEVVAAIDASKMGADNV